jgi:hypothetical protein
LAAAVGGAPPGVASIVCFTSRPLWTTAAGAPLATESFESTAIGAIGNPYTFPSGLSSNVISGLATPQVEAGDPSSFALVNTTVGGSHYLRFGNSAVPGTWAVQYGTGGLMTAYGFDISGFQPTTAGTGGIQMSTVRNNVVQDTFLIPSTIEFSVQFFGFTSTSSFDAVRITFAPVGPNDLDIVAFDEVAWVSVPGPGAACVLGLGALGPALRRRRQG